MNAGGSLVLLAHAWNDVYNLIENNDASATITQIRAVAFMYEIHLLKSWKLVNYCFIYGKYVCLAGLFIPYNLATFLFVQRQIVAAVNSNGMLLGLVPESFLTLLSYLSAPVIRSSKNRRHVIISARNAVHVEMVGQHLSRPHC